MSRSHRTRLRAACVLHHHYELRSREPTAPDPPTEHWQRLQDLWRQWQLCESHHLTATGELLRERYRQALEQLGSRCRYLGLIDQSRSLSPPPSLRLIHDELQALELEFPEVRYDLAEKTISVITEPITLDGIHLGPFEIRLEATQLESSPPYEVIALQPHPAGDSPDTPHPHVHDRTLCEGEAKEAIRLAFAQGRLCDACLLISRVLYTYNPSSAYAKLVDWEGVSCPDCGGTVSTEELCSCDDCFVERCDGCLTSCRECGNSLCSSCEQLCDDCQEPHCASCLESCVDCARDICPACRTDTLCADCHDLQQDFDDDETDPAHETTPPPPVASASGETSEPAHIELHSHRLGEAPLPA